MKDSKKKRVLFNSTKSFAQGLSTDQERKRTYLFLCKNIDNRGSKNYREVEAVAAKGEDITEIVLLKWIPYAGHIS